MKKIIYFDGVCNLCNRLVRFVINHDKLCIFSFSSLQSEFAKNIENHINGQDINYNTIVYQDGKSFYIKSDAVLKILKDFQGVWRVFYILKFIPRPWRDWLYDVIARNRYKVFGKMDQCMMPSKEVKERFID